LYFLFSSVNTPKKLDTNYNTTIVIDDANDALTDEEEVSLNATFTSFTKLTGITPAFWSPTPDSYQNLTAKTLNYYSTVEYTKKFSDERHLFISYIKGYDWAFEVVQGNDTDGIINEKVGRTFTKNIYDKLENGKTIFEAIDYSFEKITPHLMDTKVEFAVDDMPALLIVWAVFTIPFVVLSVYQLVNLYYLRNAKKMPEDSVLKNCPYCSNPYYTKTVTLCPKCGNPLPEEEPVKEEPTDTETKEETPKDDSHRLI
jgi:hypothetical protein